MGVFWRLFSHKHPYDIQETEDDFIEATRLMVRHHEENCPEYANILKRAKFCTEGDWDVSQIPPIPSLYFKRNQIYSIPQNKITLKAESSGTKGSKSNIVLDNKTFKYGIPMILRFFSYHKLISLLPVRYIILGYNPKENPNLGAAKTAYHTTKLAPALSRTYALKRNGETFSPNAEGVLRILEKHPNSTFRFEGFPYMLYIMLCELKKAGIKINAGKRSKILLGGGWKGFEEVSSEEFYALAEEVLGINSANITEFFSAVEHPLPYVKCKEGHFHVPIYSRVVIRDSITLEQLEDGRAGILNFVSPLVWSMPLVSVMTDDIAVKGTNCECGNAAPYFKLLGRAGVSGIKTCAANIAGGEG